MFAVADEKSTFARRLEALRKQAGITQYELARRAGLSKQAMSQLERGERDPAWETVRKLARALEVSIAEFDDTDEPGVLPEPRPVGKAGRPRKTPEAAPESTPDAPGEPSMTEDSSSPADATEGQPARAKPKRRRKKDEAEG